MPAGITLLVSLITLATVGILAMDAGHLPLLWLCSYCATLAIGLGVQAINAAFGGIGQLVSMFVFIVLGDRVRAILCFDARGDAGLTRAWIMTAVGTALALLFGCAMTERRH